MRDFSMAALLGRTYDRRLTAYRPLPEGGEEKVWDGAACALSRTAKTTAPTPPEEGAALTESGYALSLYTPPEVWLRLGDRLEISDGTGRCCYARAADSMHYASHCVTVVRILEVTPPAET